MSKKSKRLKKKRRKELKRHRLTPEQEALAEEQYIDRLTMPFCLKPLSEEEIEDMKRRGVI